jgi:hypothetical protein
MAKKRGGLAGVWDRNKGVIKKVAPAALSFIPGVGVPLAAAAGAAMEGLDRPGKSGIGLDIGGAIKGGISGYGIGKGTQMAAGGIKNLLTAGTKPISPVNIQPGLTPGAEPSIAAPKMGTQLTSSAARGSMPSVGAPSMADVTISPDRAFSMGGTSPLPMKTGMDFASVPNLPGEGGGVRGLLTGAGKAAGKANQFFKDNKDLIAMAGKYVMGDPREEAALMSAETERMAFQAKEDERKRERERQQAMARLLMPMLTQGLEQQKGFQYGSSYADAMRKNG